MARTVAAPQHYVPPSAREMRAQSVHRLLIGLSGLAGMLLIVGLANIIMDRAQLGDSETGAASGAAASKSSASDPLADIGVAPAAVPSQSDAPGKGKQ